MLTNCVTRSARLKMTLSRTSDKAKAKAIILAKADRVFVVSIEQRGIGSVVICYGNQVFVLSRFCL